MIMAVLPIIVSVALNKPPSIRSLPTSNVIYNKQHSFNFNRSRRLYKQHTAINNCILITTVADEESKTSLGHRIRLHHRQISGYLHKLPALAIAGLTFTCDNEIL